jgi:hypothetical protein
MQMMHVLNKHFYVVTLAIDNIIEDTSGCQPSACADACEGTIVEGTQHDNHDNTHNNDHDRVVEEPVQKCAQVPMVQTVTDVRWIGGMP